jgi:hypothetical protein
MKRIIISLIIFALIPVCAHVLNLFIHEEDLSMMVSMNVLTSVLIIYDWNLVGIHYNRAKNNIPDTILFFVIGLVLIRLWTWFGMSFLQVRPLLPAAETAVKYPYAVPSLLIAFSYIQAAMVNISFKCITDHLDVRSREIQAILISGILFGLVYTIAFTSLPLSMNSLFRTYLYNLVLVAILSYLYNQSNSFIPGILSMGTIYLLLMLSEIL